MIRREVERAWHQLPGWLETLAPGVQADLIGEHLARGSRANGR